MMHAITTDEVARFERDGFVVVEDILDSMQVTRVLAAMDHVHRGKYTLDRRPANLRKPLAHLGRGESIRWYLNARILDGDLWTIVTDPRLGAMAAALLRTPSISIVEDQLLDKPGPGLPCSFHQDYGYWLFSTSTQMITCWIALVDMTLELGPLQLIPGSHRWGHRSNPRELIVGSEDTWMEAVERARPATEPAGELASACVRAGSGVFLHCLTFHGSPANKSTSCRRAFSLHWAGEDCKVDRLKLTDYTYPYFFAGIPNGGRVINKYMPLVYTSRTSE